MLPFQEKPPKRILLKLSGEMLSSGQKTFTPSALEHIVESIRATKKDGIGEIGIVIGGGNLFRGREAQKLNIRQTTADRVGMLATCMNGLILQETFEQAGLSAIVMGDGSLHPHIEPFYALQAKKELEKQTIVIFVNGLAQPFFTTDTAAVVRAQEIEADLVVKATKVPGVFDKDPVAFPDAHRYTTLSYAQALEKKLEVMDDTAFCLLQKSKLPLFVFRFGHPLSFCKAFLQQECGTWIVSQL